VSEPAIACDVVDALELVTLERRSPVLDGSIPLRAAQGCKPFLDGNSAGLHVRFRIPAVILKEGALQLTDEDHDRIASIYPTRLDALVRRGLLTENGYWDGRLRNGLVWHEGRSMFVWTGLLVRPAAGVRMMVTRAYNRHLPAAAGRACDRRRRGLRPAGPGDRHLCTAS
jgi:hypothetical protein